MKRCTNPACDAREPEPLPQAKPAPRWVSVATMAAESSVSASEIRRRIRSGELPSMFLGDHLLRVRRQDFEAWMAGWERSLEPKPLRAAGGRR
jgi:excisionase family DNA binding protein